MDKIFLALASTSRRQILVYLSGTDLTAGEIAARFKMTKPSISQHLSVLESAGLVRREKRGRHVHYGLNNESLFTSVHTFLASCCPLGNPLKKESSRLAKSKQRALMSYPVRG